MSSSTQRLTREAIDDLDARAELARQLERRDPVRAGLVTATLEPATGASWEALLERLELAGREAQRELVPWIAPLTEAHWGDGRWLPEAWLQTLSDTSEPLDWPALTLVRLVNSRVSLSRKPLTNLAGHEQLRGVTRVTLSLHKRGANKSLAAVASSPLLDGVEELRLDGTKLGAAGLGALLAAPSQPLRRLRSLRLFESVAEPEAIGVLANSEQLGRLQALDIESCDTLGDAAAFALANSTTLVGLRRLDFGFNGVGEAGTTALLRSPLAARLEHLRLRHNPLGDNEGGRALVELVDRGNLRSLDVAFCGLGPKTAEALLASHGLDRLDAFDITLDGADHELEQRLRVRIRQ